MTWLDEAKRKAAGMAAGGQTPPAPPLPREPAALLAELDRRGFKARVGGDGRVYLSGGTLTPDEGALVQQSRPALVELIRARERVEGALDAHEPDWPDRPAGEDWQGLLLTLAVVTVEGCAPAALDPGRWEALRASVAAWNRRTALDFDRVARKEGWQVGLLSDERKAELLAEDER